MGKSHVSGFLLSNLKVQSTKNLTLPISHITDWNYLQYRQLDMYEDKRFLDTFPSSDRFKGFWTPKYICCLGEKVLYFSQIWYEAYYICQMEQNFIRSKASLSFRSAVFPQNIQTWYLIFRNESFTSNIQK